jgi:hypothetical protein
MKDNLTNSNSDNEVTVRESIYSLLIRSEEKQRGFFETAIYALFILCAVFSVWQFAQHPVTIPAQLGSNSPRVVAVERAADARS